MNLSKCYVYLRRPLTSPKGSLSVYSLATHCKLSSSHEYQVSSVHSGSGVGGCQSKFESNDQESHFRGKIKTSFVAS